MTVTIATLIFLLGIVGLFVLNRENTARSSMGLWIPTTWLVIAGSRNISEWMPSAPSAFSTDRYLEGSPIDRNFQILILAAALVVLVSRGRQIGPILRANIPILIFLGYCCVSILWSEFPEVAFKRWTKLAGDFAMVMLILSDRAPKAAIQRVLVRIGFLLVPLSILFIRYYPEFGRRYSRWEGAMSYTGVTTDKNTLGMMCLIVGLPAVWRLVGALRNRDGDGKRGPLVAQAVLAAAVVWLLVSVNSATALSCFLLCSGLMIVVRLFAVVRKPAALRLLVLLTIGVPFSALFLNIGTSGLVEGLGRNSTLTGRTLLWDAALSTVESPLLGTGYESFWLGDRVVKVWRIIGQTPNEAHNGYLEIYINLGWVGVCLLAILIVTGWRNVFRGFRRDQDLGLLRLAYFVSALAYNFSEAAFKMTSPVWILFVWAIAVVPIPRVGKARGPGNVGSMEESAVTPMTAVDLPWRRELI